MNTLLFTLHLRRPYRLSIHAVLAPLALMMVVWLWILLTTAADQPGPNARSFGVDFAHTYAASHLVHHGGDPYNYRELWQTEYNLIAPLQLPVEIQSQAVRVGTSTFFLWALQPLTFLPYQLAAILWIILTYAVSAVGILAILAYLGWSRRAVPAALFLAMPQVVLGAYYGNMSNVVFAAIACSLPLLERYPVVAGILLSVACIKLPVALPIAGLIMLFLSPRRLPVIIGFLGAFVLRQLFIIDIMGPIDLEWWIPGLLGFSNSIELQSNLTTLSGLYVRWEPQNVRIVLELLTIAGASIITLGYWWRTRDRLPRTILQVGWLWCLWMVATPYSHFIDEMLLAPVVLALVGRDAEHVTRPASIAAIYLLFFSLLLFSWAPGGAQLLALPLIGVGVCCAVAVGRGHAPAPSAHPHSLPDTATLQQTVRGSLRSPPMPASSMLTGGTLPTPTL